MKFLLCGCAIAHILFPARAESVRLAVIGDYGVDTAAELSVANLVAGLQPEFVVTTGDNNYLGGANIDRAIGKYYQSFIGNYAGSYGGGASSNRFFPAIGNHDWENGYAAHLNYFTLPGNERYYDVRRGPIHLFVVNTDAGEPDGTTSNSAQARSISNAMQRSSAPWKVVALHHPPYASTMADPDMRWPFAQWGAALVLAGHAHSYERLTNEITHVVCGSGGAPLHTFTSATSESAMQYDADHGALRITATESNLIGEFWSVAGGGTVVDRFTLWRPPRLSVSFSSGVVRVSWPTNHAQSFRLEAGNGVPVTTWTAVTNPAVESGGVRTVTLPASGAGRVFRARR